MGVEYFTKIVQIFMPNSLERKKDYIPHFERKRRRSPVFTPITHKLSGFEIVYGEGSSFFWNTYPPPAPLPLKNINDTHHTLPSSSFVLSFHPSSLPPFLIGKISPPPLPKERVSCLGIPFCGASWLLWNNSSSRRAVMAVRSAGLSPHVAAFSSPGQSIIHWINPV